MTTDPRITPESDDDGAWMIVYEDADVRPDVFSGCGARAAALATFERRLMSWNCHLFERISGGEQGCTVRALQAERDAAVALNADYEVVLADKRRLARAIDVAMHGESGAAQQASLCDLVSPAAELRVRAEAAEAERDAMIKVVRAVDDVMNDGETPVPAVIEDAMSDLLDVAPHLFEHSEPDT